MNRREFITLSAAGILSAVTSGAERLEARVQQAMKSKKTVISLVRTSDRSSGIKRAVDLLQVNPVKDRDVLLKPNFNTADPFPGSTHNDTLTSLLVHLKDMGAGSITVGERSGPPDTSDVLKEKGTYEICEKFGTKLINFEELSSADWIRVKPDQSHWRNGFDVARPILDSDCIVSTCCLKTHGHGGVFTMSLKLSVGITHKRNMTELHTSFLSMRKMIAEVNQAYNPSLILLDAMEAFVDGGPDRGSRKRADVILAGTDRIAIDAVGLAILKELGSNKDIMGKGIFEQEQIARAVELGLGITGPDEIKIVTDDNKSEKYAEKIAEILLKG